MKFKIHRGTKEIGGSCVEVWTENTRILLDFGMPLVEKTEKSLILANTKTANPLNWFKKVFCLILKGFMTIQRI
jgi:ribonuclease J